MHTPLGLSIYTVHTPLGLSIHTATPLTTLTTDSGLSIRVSAFEHVHPKTLIEMCITCLDRVSANSEKGRDSEWAVRVEQRLPSRFGQSGAVRELNLVQIVVEVSATKGGLPSTWPFEPVFG